MTIHIDLFWCGFIAGAASVLAIFALIVIFNIIRSVRGK